MQVAQNKGIHKITGVFQTTPMEPLHNLTGIPPIPYFMTKLMDSYTNRLQNMAPQAIVQRVLTKDWCHCWPDYVIPITNLTCVSQEVTYSTYCPLGAISKKEHSLPCLTGFLPCRCLTTSIVSTFKVIKGINFCKTYQNW